MRRPRRILFGGLVFFLFPFLACDGGGPAGPDSNTLVRTLVDDVKEGGNHTLLWDLLDDQGVPAPAGAYRAVVRLENGTAEDVFSVVDAVPSPGLHAPSPGTTGLDDPLPVELSIEATPDPVATGSTLWIEYALPQSGKVLVWIEEE